MLYDLKNIASATAARAHRDEQGQSIIFTTIILFTLFLFLALAINVGSFVGARIDAQNSADTLAMSGAAWQARGLNLSKAMNTYMVFKSAHLEHEAVQSLTVCASQFFWIVATLGTYTEIQECLDQLLDSGQEAGSTSRMGAAFKISHDAIGFYYVPTAAQASMAALVATDTIDVDFYIPLSGAFPFIWPGLKFRTDDLVTGGDDVMRELYRSTPNGAWGFITQNSIIQDTVDALSFIADLIGFDFFDPFAALDAQIQAFRFPGFPIAGVATLSDEGTDILDIGEYPENTFVFIAAAKGFPRGNGLILPNTFPNDSALGGIFEDTFFTVAQARPFIPRARMGAFLEDPVALGTDRPLSSQAIWNWDVKLTPVSIDNQILNIVPVLGSVGTLITDSILVH